MTRSRAAIVADIDDEERVIRALVKRRAKAERAVTRAAGERLNAGSLPFSWAVKAIAMRVLNWQGRRVVELNRKIAAGQAEVTELLWELRFGERRRP